MKLASALIVVTALALCAGCITITVVSPAGSTTAEEVCREKGNRGVGGGPLPTTECPEHYHPDNGHCVPD